MTLSYSEGVLEKETAEKKFCVHPNPSFSLDNDHVRKYDGENILTLKEQKQVRIFFSQKLKKISTEAPMRKRTVGQESKTELHEEEM